MQNGHTGPGQCTGDTGSGDLQVVTAATRADIFVRLLAPVAADVRVAGASVAFVEPGTAEEGLARLVRVAVVAPDPEIAGGARRRIAMIRTVFIFL